MSLTLAYFEFREKIELKVPKLAFNSSMTSPRLLTNQFTTLYQKIEHTSDKYGYVVIK